jgi:outer membrane receptor protein involved in Fe transport
VGVGRGAGAAAALGGGEFAAAFVVGRIGAVKTQGIGMKGAVLAVGCLLCGVAHAEEVATIPVQTLPEEKKAEAAPAEKSEQSEKPEKVIELEAVVITGEKVNRSQQKTNASVAVKTGKQIEIYGDQSVEDVLRRTGNAIVSENGQFSLRGVNSTGSESGEFGTPVASMYVDGVVLDRIGQQFGAADLFDVQQVEVLRGPQSTNQGRNSLAGAVVVKTRDPSRKPDTRFRFIGAGRNTSVFAGAFGVPLTEFEGKDGLAARLVLDRRSDDGFIPNVTRNDPAWQGSDTTSSRFKFKATQGAYTGLLTAAQTRNSQGPDVNFERAGNFGSRTSEANEASRNKGRTRSLAWDNGFQFSKAFGLQVNLSGLESEQDSFRDFDQTREAISTLRQTANNQSRTVEVRFNVTDWQGLNGFVGFYGGNFKTSAPSRVEGFRSEVEANTRSYIDLDFNARFDNRGFNRALFGTVDWQVGKVYERLEPLEPLTLTFGLRYDTERTEAQAPFTVTRAELVTCTGSPNNCAPPVPAMMLVAGLLPNAGEQQANGDFSALLPKLAARWQFSPMLNAGLTYSEGYRSGGAEVLFSTGQINQFRPEFTKNYEFSLRTELLDKKLNLAFNAYYVDWKDQQVAVRTANGNDSMIVNAAQSRLQGAELELSGKLTSWLNAYSSLGYAQTEYLNYQNAGRDFSGNQFTKAPPFTGSLGAQFKLPQGFGLVLNYQHSDAYFSEPDNSAGSRTDAYDLFDARLSWTHKSGLSLTAFGRNLTDASYSTYRFPVPEAGGTRAGQFVSYGAPRTFGVQIEGKLP